MTDVFASLLTVYALKLIAFFATFLKETSITDNNQLAGKSFESDRRSGALKLEPERSVWRTQMKEYTRTKACFLARFAAKDEMEADLILPPRNQTQIILEAFLCTSITLVSLVGNTMVAIAVYRNDRLRTTTNLYIIALAVSDLACAAIEMPLTTGTLIAGRWIFGDAVCQLDAFVDVFVTYVSPATIGLTAFNRYIRIVKADKFNDIFSPVRSKLYLSLTWLSLMGYIVVARATGWQNFVFTPGYATCILGHVSELRKTVHYILLVSLYFIIPLFVSFFSYYKVFKAIREHNVTITPQLQTPLRSTKVTLHEIKLSKSLSIVVASFFLCWVPFWLILLLERFSLAPVSRKVQLMATMFLFVSSSINPFIYAGSNRAFRREFKKMLSVCRKQQHVTHAPAAIAMPGR